MNKEDISRERTELLNTLREIDEQANQIESSGKNNLLKIMKLKKLRKKAKNLEWMLNDVEGLDQLYDSPEEKSKSK